MAILAIAIGIVNATTGIPLRFVTVDASTQPPVTLPNPTSEAARGLHYGGLVRESDGKCGNHFRLQVAALDAVCTHGPDPAPPGVDVTVARSTEDLLAAGPITNASHTGSVRCIGDGVSGQRVQAVYAVSSDRVDRFDQISSSIVAWAGQIDGVFSQSASESGGDRHVRFMMNPDCTLKVAKVVLSPTGDDSFANQLTELRQQGYDRSLTKYLIWTDATVYCGIAQVISDDSPGASNANNTNTEYARVDSGCWGRGDHLSEAHELMHSLGGVQASAPHATPNAHCTDESDTMCYSDAAGVTMTFPCAVGHEWLFDCNNDDYFDTNPSAGTYLATHWNTARSPFLHDPLESPLPTTTTTTTVPSTTTTTTAVPATTTTLAPSTSVISTFSGSLSSKQRKKTFSVTVGAGTSSEALQYSTSGRTKTSTTLQLRVLAANGTVVASGSGPSVLRLAATLAASTYTFEVSGSGSASFTLTVAHTAP